MTSRSTIVALSSGSVPAAIGVVRVSGPEAGAVVRSLVGECPTPRRARLARLRNSKGDALDDALVLWFPGPRSATGEDLAEFHCHGGRAVIDAVENAVLEVSGTQRAEPGEFTRRAFANGRIDLAQAEGLGDLLAAQTEVQRAAALQNASGALSRQVGQWREQVLTLSASIEAVLDFSDEDDVEALPEGFTWNLEQLSESLNVWLARPRAEKLGEGFRVALAGPPNAGKSTLFNALVESEAAITSALAGTTRDVLERNVALDGVPFSFVDTAGLRADSSDEIERIGIDRAKRELERADLTLWLGSEGQGPQGAWEIAARSDAADFTAKENATHIVSAKTGEGLAQLTAALVAAARETLPKPGEAVLNARQYRILAGIRDAVEGAARCHDPLLIGEDLRTARAGLDQLVGHTTTEDMLDALFGRFCIGK